MDNIIMYIDYNSILELEEELGKENLLLFLEGNIIVSIDVEAYYYLVELKENKAE